MLKTAYKHHPANTPVKVIGQDGAIAQVKISGQQYLLPTTMLTRINSNLAKQDQISHEKAVHEHILRTRKPVMPNATANPAYLNEAKIRIQCICGINSAVVPYMTRWADERQAITNLIQSCEICTMGNSQKPQVMEATTND